jgi:hypothetical protein
MKTTRKQEVDRIEAINNLLIINILTQLYIAKQQMLYGIETKKIQLSFLNYIKHFKQEYCNKRGIKLKQYLCSYLYRTF